MTEGTNVEMQDSVSQAVSSSGSNNAARAVIDYERIVSEFLTGDNLRKVFSHLCNHSSGQVTDPISDVVTTMLTCPVQMVVSEVGVALFRDHPNALYPFSEMDENQRYYVEGIVISCMRQHDISSRTNSHVVMQMGGGCILYTEPHGMQTVQGVFQPSVKQQNCKTGVESSTSACARLLCARDVFEALCDCIFASKSYGTLDVRYTICSIVMQRVVGMTHVSRDDQQHAHTYALKKLEEGGGRTVPALNIQ